MAVLNGFKIPHQERLRERMGSPRPGDLVIETTTIWMKKRPHLDGIGILLREIRELVDMEWNEDTDGPHPTEHIVYIKTFDDREFRWRNASFIAAVGDYIPQRPSV